MRALALIGIGVLIGFFVIARMANGADGIVVSSTVCWQDGADEFPLLELPAGAPVAARLFVNGERAKGRLAWTHRAVRARLRRKGTTVVLLIRVAFPLCADFRVVIVSRR